MLQTVSVEGLFFIYNEDCVSFTILCPAGMAFILAQNEAKSQEKNKLSTPKAIAGPHFFQACALFPIASGFWKVFNIVSKPFELIIL